MFYELYRSNLLLKTKFSCHFSKLIVLNIGKMSNEKQTSAEMNLSNIEAPTVTLKLRNGQLIPQVGIGSYDVRSYTSLKLQLIAPPLNIRQVAMI